MVVKQIVYVGQYVVVGNVGYEIEVVLIDVNQWYIIVGQMVCCIEYGVVFVENDSQVGMGVDVVEVVGYLV